MPEERKTFEELGLSTRVLKAISDKGFEEPTDIQARTIPMILKGNSNIIAQSQTGTGKTAAFGLPLLDMIDKDARGVHALILAPTRELAVQVAEELNSFHADKGLSVVPIYGGQSIDQQLRRLRKGAHIVVGTPGRVIDHIKRKTLKLGTINELILDEADEMLNMGFIDDLEEIMKHTNPDKRTILFSATMPDRIRQLAARYMDGYEQIRVKNEQLTTNLTEQIYFEVRRNDTFEALCRIIDVEDEFYGLVFCRTKRDVDDVARHLNERGYDADGIHGDIPQNRRERVLKSFRSRKVTILVATDVAARGIDVTDLTHVINYALPQDPEAYVHRIGRTGRAGKEGTAITFITPGEYRKLMFIQRVAKADIKKQTLPKVSDIIDAKKQRIQDAVSDTIAEDIPRKYYETADSLIEQNDPRDVLAALLKHSFRNELSEGNYRDINAGKGKKQRKGVDSHGTARLFVALGKKDRTTPKKLVDLIIKQSGLKSREIDDVCVLDNFSFVNVPFKKAEQLIKCFKTPEGRPLISHARRKGK